MKQIDQYTIKVVGIPSMVLMERAALSVAEETKKLLLPGDRIWVACGTGNNGADGIAAARLLFLSGYDVSVLLAGNMEQTTPEWKQQYEIAENLGMSLIEFCDFIPGRCEVIIDALFGVGLTRPVEGEYRELMEMLKSRNARAVIAVDLPSGVNADNGEIMGLALNADVTVTFGWEKTGLAQYPGKGCCGRIVISDIGFPKQALTQTEPEYFTHERQDLTAVPSRPEWSNKGTFGKVLVIAGSENMSGAAYLSGLAAYRMGAGLVKILTTACNREILQAQLPEAILATYEPDAALELTEGFRNLIEDACAWAGVIVLGPGISQNPYAKNLVESVLENAYVPIVLDADGLNIIAANPRLTSYYTENIIITPHIGEMSRLTGRSIPEIQADPAGVSKEYGNRYGITCVLKDAVTVAALKDGRIYLNSSGNSAMAKAGSGDVLTGIIAGLLALGLEESEAACLGVYLHGCAGDDAKDKWGEHGVLARNLADCLPCIWRKL